jgi:hypothetical protein
MADLTVLLERVVVLAVIVTPAALVVLILSGIAAQVFGDPIPASPRPIDADQVRDEEPVPRWRPELARRSRRVADPALGDRAPGAWPRDGGLER